MISQLSTLQGGGITLGPDCDGMLNNCEQSGPATCSARSAKEFSLDNLLSSVQLPRHYPAASAPEALITKPKNYQLQVSSHYPAHSHQETYEAM